MSTEVGLRERKKLAVRAALSHAAWSLMVSDGLEAATPDAIASAADVSPRTFRNYFGSREEAILDWLVQRGASLAEQVRARPADEPVWVSLVEVLPNAVAQMVGARKDLAVLMQAVQSDPAMRAQHLVVFERGRWLEEVVAERTGTDPDRDLEPRLLAAVVGVALRKSIEIWAAGVIDCKLPELIRRALEHVRAGLPIGA